MTTEDNVPVLTVKFRAEKQIILRQRLYCWTARLLGCLAAIGVVGLLGVNIYQAIVGEHGFDNARIIGVPVSLIVLVGIGVGLFVCSRASNLSEEYEWLPPSCCNSLLHIFTEYPELEEYRVQVVEAGRRFAMYEYHALRAYRDACRSIVWEREWRESKALEEAKYANDCRALYGVPSAAQEVVS